MRNQLNFGKPFYNISILRNEKDYSVEGKSIIINLSDKPLAVGEGTLSFLKSTIVTNCVIADAELVCIVDDYEIHEDAVNVSKHIIDSWEYAYDIFGGDSGWHAQLVPAISK
jgi:hypothetical protein